MSKKISKDEIISLASQRNHELENSDMFETIYKDINSKLSFKCNTCGCCFETTLRSYKSAKKTGCTGCKRQITKQTHSGKTLSAETKEKIGAKARKRPGSLTGKTGPEHPRYTGGYGRDKNKRSNADYAWINGVKKIYGRACVLTGETESIVVHHLDGWNCYPEKRYDISNGVVLCKKVHKQFHDAYKYGDNTEKQFADFSANQYGIDWFSKKAEFFNKTP